MKRVFVVRVVMIVCLLGGFFQSQPPAPVLAAPDMRVQVYQHGDFLLIGNTLGYDCSSSTPAPVVGTVGECGSNATNDSGSDIYWRADDPDIGQAAANNTITAAQARSTAVLSIPTGAEVTHAYLYWSATLASSGAYDSSATLERVGEFSQTVDALDSRTGANNSYRSVADVTPLVQSYGSGAYRVSDVDIANLVNLNDQTAYAAWWMVVFYKLSSEPFRQLTLFDGLDTVNNGDSQNFTLSGFWVPQEVGFSKLGVVAMEGDKMIAGDSLAFNGSQLSNALNPFDNFFNSTRSALGAATSVSGDLPQMNGVAGSMSGIDLDIVDITSNLAPGQTSASITASSTGDVYFLTSLVTSIVTDVRVTNFTATSPSTTLDIPITDFATTGTGTAYLITLSETPPAADDPNWSASIPTSYTVGGDGTYTLYPWFKDENGIISTVYDSPVTVVVDRPIWKIFMSIISK